MMQLFLLIFILQTFISQFTAGANQQDRPCVTTTNGRLCGFTQTFYSKNLALFYGVPYAKQPDMNTRFRLPTTAEPYANGTFNATTIAPYCAQLNGSSLIGQMDCLYMNIYIPNAAQVNQRSSGGLPVMFWIHGGAFYAGGASEYDGRFLSALGDVIVVTTNYRLGIFGFGYLPDTDMVGNVGLLDQRMALKWVHDNIEAFGGDNERITIFGESAGAASVSAHLASQKSLQLFKHAIAESGSTMCQWGMKGGEYLGQITEDIARLAFCKNLTPAETFECLQDRTTMSLLLAYKKFLGLKESHFQYVSPLEEDKLFFHGNAHQIAYSTDYQGRSIMIGTNGDEGSTFLYDFLPEVFQDYTSLSHDRYFHYYIPQALGFLLGLTLKGPQEAVAYFYAPPRNPNYFQSMVQLVSDVGIRCCAGQDHINFVRKTADKTFAYDFNHTTDYSKLVDEFGAYHSLELQFLFGTTLTNPKATSAERALSLMMIGYWTDFAKNGEPCGSQEWPSLTKTSSASIDYKVLQVERQPVVEGLKEQECSFWRSMYQFIPKARQNFEY